MKPSFHPWLGAAMLAGAAAAIYPGRNYVLIAIMLLWPVFDRRWQPPPFPRNAANYLSWIMLVVVASALLLWQPEQTAFADTTLITAALPEEWFFRAYLMTCLGRGWRANAVASAIFSLLHGLTVGWTTALLVFAPSLFYGWLYQRTRDLPLLILVHGLSNLVFALFIAGPLTAWLG
jgi:membrane protease YdiL (CAAX protease family)